jgi:hypothetical protein
MKMKSWKIEINSKECPSLFGSPQKEYCGIPSKKPGETFEKCTESTCPLKPKEKTNEKG